MREIKTLPLAAFKVDATVGPGSFEGRASTFGTVDSYGDTIEPGAYRETITQFLTRGFIGWGHDWNEPIGFVTSADERSDGLYIAGVFHSDEDAQKYRLRAAERFAAGKFMGLSIGYEAEAYEYRKVDQPVRGMFGEFTDKVRALTKIKLYEVSLVTVPAEENSGVTGMKRFPDHADAALAAVRSLVERSRSLADLRAKEGRVISEANRQRLNTLMEALATARADIEELLSTTTPPEKGVDPHALFADFQRTLARLNGVAV